MEPHNKAGPSIEEAMLDQSVAGLYLLLKTKEREFATLQRDKEKLLHQLSYCTPSQKPALQKELDGIIQNETVLKQQLQNLRASYEAIQSNYGIDRYGPDFENTITNLTELFLKPETPLQSIRKNRNERDTDRER